MDKMYYFNLVKENPHHLKWVCQSDGVIDLIKLNHKKYQTYTSCNFWNSAVLYYCIYYICKNMDI